MSNQVSQRYLRFIGILFLQVEVQLRISETFVKLYHKILRGVLLCLGVNLADLDPLDETKCLEKGLLLLKQLLKLVNISERQPASLACPEHQVWLLLDLSFAEHVFEGFF